MSRLPMAGRRFTHGTALIVLAFLASACESPVVRELAQTTAANTETFVGLVKDHQVKRTGVYTLSARITAEDQVAAEEVRQNARLDTALIDDDRKRKKVERIRNAFQRLRADIKEDVARRREIEASLLSRLDSAELNAQAIKDLNKALASLGTELSPKESFELYKSFVGDVMKAVEDSFEKAPANGS